MSENESRPLERWSGSVGGYNLQFRRVDATEQIRQLVTQQSQMAAKAAAFDRVLAAWGMTWEEYQQQPGTDAPDTGREPNVDSEKDRPEPQV